MKWLIIAICFALSPVHAQNLNGLWINDSLQALDRMDLKTASQTDVQDASYFIGYVTGALAGQASNTALASIYATLLKDVDSEKATVAKTTALAFSPLHAMPGNLSGKQIFGIIRKYVADNPSRWNEPAYSLIVDALKYAYPPAKP